jgi:hypothetical protein
MSNAACIRLLITDDKITRYNLLKGIYREFNASLSDNEPSPIMIAYASSDA